MIGAVLRHVGHEGWFYRREPAPAKAGDAEGRGVGWALAHAGPGLHESTPEMATF